MSAVGTITAVLFDWDGTLIDSRASLLAAWRESTETVLGRRFPATAAEEREVFTLPGSEIWPRLVADPPQLEELVGRFQTAYERSGELVRAIPGMAEALGELRDAHVAIAVVTSKARRRFVLDARRTALDALIDVAVCAEDAAATKPDPRPVLAALEHLGTPAANALMVGDTVVDVTAGLRAGTAVAGVLWGAGTEEELHAAGASTLLTDPSGLVALVAGGTL